MIRTLLFLLASTAASAQMPAPADVRYRVDLILFLDRQGAETPASALPLPESLLDPADTQALAAAGIEILPTSDSALSKELGSLRRSKRYQPVTTLSWIQKNPPAERGPALRLRWGALLSAQDLSLNAVDGSVALLMGRYLHLDADLGYHSVRGDGSLGSVVLRERRRMKRDELHYLDSPKLGILAKVSKLKS